MTSRREAQSVDLLNPRGKTCACGQCRRATFSMPGTLALQLRPVADAFLQGIRRAGQQISEAVSSINWERINRMRQDAEEIRAIADQHRSEARVELDRDVDRIYRELGLERKP